MTPTCPSAQFQPSEVLFLIMMLSLAVFWLRRHRRIEQVVPVKWLGGVVLALLCAAGLTNIENVLFPGVANLLEHLSYFLAGVLITMCVWRIGREELGSRPATDRSGGTDS